MMKNKLNPTARLLMGPGPSDVDPRVLQVMAIPVIVFFLIVQGKMTSGLVSGAVKG